MEKKIAKVFIRTCNLCGEKLGNELMLSDTAWNLVCSKANIQSPYKKALICPDCIEKILGRPVTLEELLRYSLSSPGIKIMFPINYWYLKKNKYLENSLGYIENHIKEFTTSRKVKESKIIYKNVCDNWLVYIAATKSSYDPAEEKLIEILKKYDSNLYTNITP